MSFLFLLLLGFGRSGFWYDLVAVLACFGLEALPSLLLEPFVVEADVFLLLL